MVSDLEIAAKAFAKEAHGTIGHRRKYTGEPYIVLSLIHI